MVPTRKILSTITSVRFDCGEEIIWCHFFLLSRVPHSWETTFIMTPRILHILYPQSQLVICCIAKGFLYWFLRYHAQYFLDPSIVMSDVTLYFSILYTSVLFQAFGGVGVFSSTVSSFSISCVIGISIL